VAGGASGTHSDIWFTRSTTYGNTWESAYALTSASGDIYYSWPTVCYGRAGAVHCVWELVSTTDYDGAIRYRRALNYAAGGIADWETTHYLTSPSDGIDDWNPTVAASHPAVRWSSVMCARRASMHATRNCAASDAGDTAERERPDAR
jgi:hypothetical protein